MPKLCIVSFICISLFTGCVSAEMRNGGAYHSITAQEAYQMMSELDDYIILDVRTESEYRAKRIPGAISIPLGQVKERAEIELPNKDAIIFVHCRSGGRSTAAAKELIKLGYKNVYDFKKITKWPGETISD